MTRDCVAWEKHKRDMSAMTAYFMGKVSMQLFVAEFVVTRGEGNGLAVLPASLMGNKLRVTFSFNQLWQHGVSGLSPASAPCR